MKILHFTTEGEYRQLGSADVCEFIVILDGDAPEDFEREGFTLSSTTDLEDNIKASLPTDRELIAVNW